MTLGNEHATSEQISQARTMLSDFIDSLISNGEPLRGKEVRISLKTYKKSKKRYLSAFPFLLTHKSFRVWKTSQNGI